LEDLLANGRVEALEELELGDRTCTDSFSISAASVGDGSA
jgi:hypothetical protein